MKTSLLKFTTLILIIGLSAYSQRLVAAETNAAATAEDLGFDFYQGRTNKVASIYSVTPTHIQVRYENGFLSRQIPRTELTGELGRRYPYDTDKGMAYAAQKSTETAQRNLAQLSAWQAAQQSAVVQREKAIETEITKLSQRDVELQKEVFTLRHMPRGNGRKVRMHSLLNEQQSIREKQIKLRSQLSALR